MAAHVLPVRAYLGVFAALLALTAATTAAAFLDLGPLNAVLMLGIAGTKATLVGLYFMHLRWSSRLTWLVVCSGFAWLGILIVFTTSDMLVRSLLPSDVSQLVREPVEAFRAPPAPGR